MQEYQQEEYTRLRSDSQENVEKSSLKSRWIVIATVVAAVIVAIGLAVGLGVGLSRECGLGKDNGEKDKRYRSAHGFYRYAAVSSNNEICSSIGNDVMARHCGHVIDATVATVMCQNAMNAHSAGIGGGSFFVYYDREQKEVHVVNARETAPANTDQNMFDDAPELSADGGLAIAVPGELKGLWHLHQKFGRVEWATLIQPTIDLCRKGAPLSKALREAALELKDQLKSDSEFSFLFDSEGEVLPEGTKIYRPKLAKTLEVIAKEGADALYNGSLAEQVVQDIQQAGVRLNPFTGKKRGCLVTLQDLQNYALDTPKPTVFELPDNLTLYSMPPPGSGVLLAFILNILSGYNFTVDSSFTVEKTAHRIVEAMKFAYSQGEVLGDDGFVDLEQNMTSRAYGDVIRKLVADTDKTHDKSYYLSTFYVKPEKSAAHSSLIDKDGNAVSVSSSINTPFGSKVKGKRTGIIFNNQMAAFDIPATTNSYGVPPSEANFIKPGNRPRSFMCPTIIVDESTEDVKLIIGSSGGSLIPTAVSLTIVRSIWFNATLTAAVDAPRMHHQLLPPELMLEDDYPNMIRKALEARGHVTAPVPFHSSVQAIGRTRNNTYLEAVADWREGGKPDGY